LERIASIQKKRVGKKIVLLRRAYVMDLKKKSHRKNAMLNFASVGAANPQL
jgi:hypothetical protein